MDGDDTSVSHRSPERLDSTLDRFAVELLSEVIAEATRRYWLRRAETFEAARPRPGDYTGRASRAELSAAWRRLTAIAQACRARAQVSPLELIEPDVRNVWEEVAS